MTQVFYKCIIINNDGYLKYLNVIVRYNINTVLIYSIILLVVWHLHVNFYKNQRAPPMFHIDYLIVILLYTMKDQANLQTKNTSIKSCV